MRSNPRPLRVSCFLPAFNEAENIRSTVEEACVALERLTSEYEVIVVNDGSTDDTGEIAEAAARRNAAVRVVHHATNRGYGSAVVTGLRSARLDYVFFTDGDGQFRVAELRNLLPLLEHTDVVIGFRRNRQDRLLRRINGGAWTFLMDILFRLRVRDVDCAFKIFRRRLITELPLSSEGAMISAEILVRLRRLGIPILQVPVSHYPRLAGEQTGGSIRVIIKAFLELCRMFRGLRRSPPLDPT